MLPLSPSVGMLELMAALVAGVSLELWLASRLARPVNGPPRLWLMLGAPLVRSAVVVVAVLVAYPALFGFRAAPPLHVLMPDSAARLAVLLGAVCLCRIVTSRLPPTMRAGIGDTLQAMLVVALVFSGYADYLGALSATVWPGVLAALALLGLAGFAPALAAGLAHDLGARWEARWQVGGLGLWCGEAARAVAVAPIVILYGYLLGLQLAM